MQIARIICINVQISVSCGRAEVSAETDTGSDCHKKLAEENQGDEIDSKKYIKKNAYKSKSNQENSIVAQ